MPSLHKLMPPGAPVKALPAAMTAAHQLLELCAGSGSSASTQSVYQPRRASRWWLTPDGRPSRCPTAAGNELWHSRGYGDGRTRPALHTVSVAGPVRSPGPRGSGGLEGLPLAAYVALLYLWGLSGVLASRQLPRSSRRWTLAGIGLAVAFRQLAFRHLVWIQAEARRNPRWWNLAGHKCR